MTTSAEDFASVLNAMNKGYLQVDAFMKRKDDIIKLYNESRLVGA